MVEGHIDFLKSLTLPMVHPIHSNANTPMKVFVYFYSKMNMFERLICLTWFKHYTIYKPSNVTWHPINTCYFMFFSNKNKYKNFFKKNHKMEMHTFQYFYPRNDDSWCLKSEFLFLNIWGEIYLHFLIEEITDTFIFNEILI